MFGCGFDADNSVDGKEKDANVVSDHDCDGVTFSVGNSGVLVEYSVLDVIDCSIDLCIDGNRMCCDREVDRTGTLAVSVTR